METEIVFLFGVDLFMFLYVRFAGDSSFESGCVFMVVRVGVEKVEVFYFERDLETEFF